ncbi:nucleotidyltransferase domain-containing protein [Halothiobacillus neapolitanus]|jgi:predicted nucleotidyltransferase|uniref:DNA polymerase beta domain protein region n=1 Tax=Halothiobacillus neapolitanus (strain ATCC 23641 / DSM 15147 / CIP 104769 / NCIMB 8539 / c2) TaxID=555778 RepID=D0KX91_HALNC|nr:nucleotidyltransferase domain-containing protein [Halothiobacillus neapolitanus]ACX95105.1 DNA polymerase beta domain protein region [Halothiobacillus neapolitanus c2]OZB84541.1 MAG: DNA polymerase subunit beta [Halothiobacillus sp. 13-55-253]TDN60941.1 nucleotidyltransferase-like protein [Halothiobacillus neapolitanus]
MRFTHKEASSIKEAFQDVFQEGTILLFGSRVDDNKKGGDIDLYIQLSHPLSPREQLERKAQFKLKLYEALGEQKIDIVIAKDQQRSIEKSALKTGVPL